MGYSTYYNGEIAVFPTLTEADAAIVRAVVEGERGKQTQAVFTEIAASPEPDLPWHTGLLKVSEDRNLFLPKEDESRPGFGMWLRLLIDHFLSARGYVLNDQVSWESEDPDDRGILFVKDSVIEIVDDLIFNGGPSWAPNHYATDDLKQAVRELLDSADNAGCSTDLTVVGSEQLEAVRSCLPQY